MCVYVHVYHLVYIYFKSSYAQTARGAASSQEIDYVKNILKVVNLKGLQNCMMGSNVTAA